MTVIKIISWNVNGLRAAITKDFFNSFEKLSPDILAIQETKIQASQLTGEMQSVKEYASFWSYSVVKKGYSGVGVYSRIKPLSVKYGIGIPRYDDEGRVIEADFGSFIFFNVYFPNGGMNEERLQYKLDFYRDFFAYTDAYRQAGKSLIIAGDYNTAHNEIDLKNPKANENTSGFLRIERDWLDQMVENGYTDTFRHLYPNTVEYSWWSYRTAARKRNAGWRIDYVFVTQDMMGKVRRAFIDTDILGSDHCPVGIEIEI